MSKNIHAGPTFDSLLEEEGILEECAEVAAKRVFAWKLEQIRKQRKLSKRKFAESMNLTETELYRLLDPNYTGVSLKTMSKAATGLGMRVEIDLVEDKQRAM